MSDDLVGAWTLESHVVENEATGERTEPFGPRPRGTLIFDPGGRMVALLTPAARPAPAEEGPGGAAAPALVAYAGRYRLEPPDRFVTSVDVAWIEAWVGTEQARRFRCHGDRLEIVNGPMRMPGPDGREQVVLATMTWRRER